MSDQSSTIDFSQYSDASLAAALERVDRNKFPLNYQACLDEIEKRRKFSPPSPIENLNDTNH
ncbi:MAG: hypothetical protein H7235_01135, partial [Bdellovibrionaceae bacterium]|nr:hypothetical protein [Pseudobdellovibrionaceae bacterium]